MSSNLGLFYKLYDTFVVVGIQEKGVDLAVVFRSGFEGYFVIFLPNQTSFSIPDCSMIDFIVRGLIATLPYFHGMERKHDVISYSRRM